MIYLTYMVIILFAAASSKKRRKLPETEAAHDESLLLKRSRVSESGRSGSDSAAASPSHEELWGNVLQDILLESGLSPVCSATKNQKYSVSLPLVHIPLLQV
jgi:hypothetical protein